MPRGCSLEVRFPHENEASERWGGLLYSRLPNAPSCVRSHVERLAAFACGFGAPLAMAASTCLAIARSATAEARRAKTGGQVAAAVLASLVGRAPITTALHPRFLNAMHVAFLISALICAIGVFASLARGQVHRGERR